MSGHHPFQSLIENLPVERKLEIEQKKKAMLVEIELREAIESTIGNWEIDSSKTSIEQVDDCLTHLRQAVKDLGGELVITAKFPDIPELSIDSFKAKAN